MADTIKAIMAEDTIEAVLLRRYFYQLLKWILAPGYWVDTYYLKN